MRLTCFKHFQAEQWEKKGRWLFRVYRGLYCLVGDKNEALLQGSLDCGFKPLVEGNAPTTWNSNNNRMVHQTWRCLTIRPQNEGKLSLMPDLSEWPKFASLHHQSPSNPQSTTGGATPPPTLPAAASMFFFSFSHELRDLSFDFTSSTSTITMWTPWHLGLAWGEGLTRNNSGNLWKSFNETYGFTV